MSMNAQVQETFARDRRLVILRLLRETGEAVSTIVLTKAVQAIGHGYADRSMIGDDARWLEQRGLVDTRELSGDTRMVSVTAEGERVATGDKRVEGVDRPSRV